MELHWNPQYIDLQNVINIARGDRLRMLKYLDQFLELIPQRMDALRISIADEDRKSTRQILHQMSPQLQFFGIPGVVTPIRRLEHEYQTMPLSELRALVMDILEQLENAVEEVQKVTQQV